MEQKSLSLLSPWDHLTGPVGSPAWWCFAFLLVGLFLMQYECLVVPNLEAELSPQGHKIYLRECNRKENVALLNLYTNFTLFSCMSMAVGGGNVGSQDFIYYQKL